jgi:uncharacterized protein YndB with AHSA1/START domain
MGFTKITIQATVSANAQKAWDYYTKPEHIVHWNFAHESWQCPSARNDVRVGGTYSARMEAKDGSFGFDFEGIYDDVVLGKKLAFSMSDGRTVVVSFEEKNSKTEVTVIFDAETENAPEMQRQGWQAILDNYKHYTETN